MRILKRGHVKVSLGGGASGDVGGGACGVDAASFSDSAGEI